MKSGPGRLVGQMLVLVLVYVVMAKFGLSLAYTTQQVTTVWPATGLALAVLFLFGFRLWPGIFVGALIANLLTNEPASVAIGIAVGNTLEAVIGAYWLRRIVQLHPTLDRLSDVFGLIVFGALYATAISATIGVICLSLGGLVAWTNFAPTWETWWVGDMMGAMIIAPLILLWSKREQIDTFLDKPAELGFLTAMVLALSVYAFTRQIRGHLVVPPLEYLVFPLIIWAAVRFKQVGVVSATFIISSIAVWGTLHGRGPFSAAPSVETNLILLQVYMFVVSATGMVLGAVVKGWKTAEAQLVLQSKELRDANLHLEEAVESGQAKEKRLTVTIGELEDTKKAMMNVLEDLEQDRSTIAKEKSQDEAMLMAIGDGLVVIDEQARIVLVNAAFEQLTGWTSAEALGRPIFDVLPAEDEQGHSVPKDARPYIKVLTSGKTVTTRLDAKPYYYVAKDGRRFPVAITVTPMFLGGKISGIVNVFRDITHELDIDRAKSEFVSLASHELRTPLTIVRWSINMLQKYTGPLTKPQQKYVEAIRHTGLEMVGLVDALLNVSRIDMGTLMIEPVSTKLAEFLTHVLDELQLLVDQKQLHFKRKIPRSLPTIQIDQQLLRVAVTNLVTNAIKYTPAGGNISLTVTATSDRVTISVSDSGYGIPKIDQSKIFTRLFRADNIKTSEPHGTGLGLYITKAVVEQSGGHIWFSSEQNKGSTFSFDLPVAGVPRRAGNKSLQSS